MSAYIEYLDSAIAALRQEAASLKASGREDEAVFCQIQINIDEICRTIYNVCKQIAKPGEFKALYLQKLDRLPGGWEKARAQALAHDDACKAVIEELKLKTLSQNRVKYLELDQETE